MPKAKREFIFIDEHGDPGPVGVGSDRFATCAVHVTDVSLEKLIECFSDMRFYRQVYGEVKSLYHDPKLRPKLVEILWHMNASHGVQFSTTYLDKATYTGPYLAPGEGIEFRNFQVRRLLEWHFHNAPLVTQQCELVFDRHGHNVSQLDNFVHYINNNWDLPRFAYITAADSLYVESVQVADLALSLFRKKHLENDPNYQTLDLSFIHSRDVTQMYKGWKP